MKSTVLAKLSSKEAVSLSIGLDWAARRCHSLYTEASEAGEIGASFHLKDECEMLRLSNIILNALNGANRVKGELVITVEVVEQERRGEA